MLIKFEAENFRSVKDRIELTLTSVNYYKEQQDQLIDTALPGLMGTEYLRVAALFGPNASGKSTIMQAPEIMGQIVCNSASMRTEAPLPYFPYLLDGQSRNKPTSFLAAFTHEGVRYEYEFSFTEYVITREKLSAFPKGREQVWFTRETGFFDAEKLSTHIKGSSFLKVPAALRPLLNDNMLLLSLMANYPKFEELEKVRPIFDWFANELQVLNRGPRSNSIFPFSGEIIDGVTGTDAQRSFIQEMMRKADIGINHTRVKSSPLADILEKIDDPNIAELISRTQSSDVVKTLVFEHEAESENIEFDQMFESEGTLQLFSLSGPVAQALESGSTIFVDEIDASLHPILVREVIRCFLEPKSNPNNAQLIFTAHNPCLLEEDFLRRDQIWLTEKIKGATELYSLSEFAPRRGDSRVNGYLHGRYSATPLVPMCFGRCSRADGGDHDE